MRLVVVDAKTLHPANVLRTAGLHCGEHSCNMMRLTASTSVSCSTKKPRRGNNCFCAVSMCAQPSKTDAYASCIAAFAGV